MGKSSLIIVLGMSVIIGFFTLRMNSNSNENVSGTMDMFNKTQSRLIANSGVEIYLEKLKHDRTMIGSTYSGNTLFGGTYDIKIEGPEDTVQVTSVANFMGVIHTTIVEAEADRVPFYPGPGAMYLSGGTVAALKKNAITGSIEINGKDHDLNGDTIPGASSVPGIAVDGATQRNDVVNMITKNTINQVLGSGGTPSVQAISNEVDWAEYAQLLADNPDILINTQEKMDSVLGKKEPWGTVADPKVTFINGDIHLNNSLTASGCGILVVNGSLEINGTFDYKGLVVAFKNTTIDIKLNGNGSILGSLVVAGNQINVEVANGNFDVLYSTQALALIDNLLTTKRFSILSWWE